MKSIGPIILACLVLAALPYAIALVALVLLGIILWGLLFRTRETVGFLLLGVLIQLVMVHPIASLALACVLGIAVWVARVRKGRSAPPEAKAPLLLTDQRSCAKRRL
jgi:hypothetical protein